MGGDLQERGDHFLTLREQEVDEHVELYFVIVTESISYSRFWIADLHMIALVEPLFSVPFERDANFIDRKNIFDQIERELHMHCRASICGLGEVGYTFSLTDLDRY